MGDVRVPQLLPHLPAAPYKLPLRLSQKQRELESAGQFVPWCHSHSVHERRCLASQCNHPLRAWPQLATLLPAQQRRIVLRLHHNLPVHPPCLQHLLPVSLAVPALPLQDQGFPSMRDAAILHHGVLAPALSPTLWGRRLLFHFIEGGIFVQLCRVTVLVGTLCALPMGYARGGTGCGLQRSAKYRQPRTRK